jgi:large subunit ribosomal protein L25
MSVDFEIVAESRSQVGKSSSRRARALADKIPAVVYGLNKPNLHIELDHSTFIRKLKNEAFYSHLLTLNVTGQESDKVVLKALQRHPFKQKIMHVDFMRVSESEKLTLHVPLHFINENKAPGVKKGGVISHMMTTVEITCLPSQLPEFIEVDVSKLDPEQAIHLSELSLPVGVLIVELLHNNDAPVVSIQMPRVVEESNAAPVAAETEVIKEKKKED